MLRYCSTVTLYYIMCSADVLQCAMNAPLRANTSGHDLAEDRVSSTLAARAMPVPEVCEVFFAFFQYVGLV